MTNARPEEIGTGAVMNMPGRQSHGTAPQSNKPSNAGCPTLHVELYRHTARFYGPRVWQLLDLAQVNARQYDRERKCWTVPADQAANVICVAEYRQRRFVTVEEVDR